MLHDEKKQLLIKRSRTLKEIRDFFFAQSYIEVETPLAVISPDQEPTIHPVPVTLTDDEGAKHQYFLHTSPEYAMKKMLASGMHRIFQMGKCFRDYESFGGTHQPEFTMLEWYTVGATYTDLMDQLDELLARVAPIWGYTLPATKRLSITELFKQHANIDLAEWSYLKRSEYEQKFFHIFLNSIEPNLPDGPVIVYDYPVQLAALSRVKKDNPHLAERFELYIDKKEVANAFGELLNAAEQQKRFEEEYRIRAESGERVFPIDIELLDLLEHIPEPTSGISVGIDRLIMGLARKNIINDVVAFPFTSH